MKFIELPVNDELCARLDKIAEWAAIPDPEARRSIAALACISKGLLYFEMFMSLARAKKRGAKKKSSG